MNRIPSAFSIAIVAMASNSALPAQTNYLGLTPKTTPYHLTIPPSIPRPDFPKDNPLTGEGVVLGGRLFFERRLSINNQQSCAAFHNPRLAFAENRRFSRGTEGQRGERNAMALENLAWKTSFFWDGRAATLREQTLQPIQNPLEMHESLSNVVAKLSADKGYRAQFTAAFGSPEITSDRVARAIEQFLLVQVSFDSKFDRSQRGAAKLTAEERRGADLFNTAYDPARGRFGADCFHCHGGPLFRSREFANNGLDSEFADPGRFKVTHRAADQGKFSVPSLRNVELTSPYMHDGRFRTLEDVVEHYRSGTKSSATLDPELARHPDRGVPFSDADKNALVAFLKTLTDERLRALPEPPETN